MLHRYLQRLRFATQINMIKKNVRVSYCTVNDHYSHVLNVSSEEDIKQFIIANTDIVSKNNLTPEMSLRLFTPNSKFWHAKPELWPFTDPYWAIYWPGGQALARYLNTFDLAVLQCNDRLKFSENSDNVQNPYLTGIC